MQVFEELVEQFMAACRKKLSGNTLRAYACDLQQYSDWVGNQDYCSYEVVYSYFLFLDKQYSPASVKRKLATLSSFMLFLQEKGAIDYSPFDHRLIKVKGFQ